MKKILVAAVLVMVALASCQRNGTGPGEEGSGSNPAGRDSLIPVPVYFRQLPDSISVDSFRLDVRYLYYICPCQQPAIFVRGTLGVVVDTVFPARVDAPGDPGGGYLRYRAEADGDTSWHYIGTLWLVWRRSFYGGRDDPFHSMAYDTVCFGQEWDSTRLNQGRAFLLILGVEAHPLLGTNWDPYVYPLYAREEYYPEVIARIFLSDGSIHWVRSLQGVVWNDPVVQEGLCLWVWMDPDSVTKVAQFDTLYRIPWRARYAYEAP